ncbi:MFS transporter [Actinomadura rudentiformis]|uniref:MFS transporter n=1 Tax=Actinomadura rudentiformis TaxID=359158 RepID=A0A6H9Z034_9ACTN|nr:MFS transporter [Actinomadura rudentiformis]KAB2347221.1 MFS transporter [Actinomadura rudentiformis]
MAMRYRSGSRAAWTGMAAMTVSFGLNFSAGVFFTPAVAAYGVNVAAITMAAAAATGLTGLAQPVIGMLLDRVGARSVLLTALTLLSASYLTLAVVQQTWQFVLAYVILGGLGFAGSSSLAVSTLISRAHGDRAGPALARAAVGINLGQLITPWAATALFEPVGVRTTYALLGAAGLAVTAALAVFLPADRVPTQPPGPLGREGLGGRGRVLASFGLHAATLYVVVLLLPKHATELGWSSVDAGRLVAVSAIAAGIASAASARLLHRHSPEALLRVLHLVRASALALAAITSDPRALVAVAALFGIASFPVIPLTMAVLTRGLQPARIGRSLAPAWLMHQFLAGLGLAGAALVHSLSGDYRGYFALGAALSLTAVLLLTPHRPATRRHLPEAPALDSAPTKSAL